jgi:hypothetical protein
MIFFVLFIFIFENCVNLITHEVSKDIKYYYFLLLDENSNWKNKNC